MSTDYIPRNKIPYNELLKTRELTDSLVKIQACTEPPHPIEEACVLTDGTDYLWARAATNGGTTFTRYGRNDPETIIQWLETLFNIELVSEYDEEFHELIVEQYREDFVTIQLPTDDSPGPWKKVWPPE